MEWRYPWATPGEQWRSIQQDERLARGLANKPKPLRIDNARHVTAFWKGKVGLRKEPIILSAIDRD